MLGSQPACWLIIDHDEIQAGKTSELQLIILTRPEPLWHVLCACYVLLWYANHNQDNSPALLNNCLPSLQVSRGWWCSPT